MSQIGIKSKTKKQKKDQSYGAVILKKLHILYCNGKMCDVVLIAGMDGQRFSCNRMVLASFSKYFKAMFLCPMRESQQSEIVLNEVSGEQLKPLLTFCYTGSMVLHEDEDDSANCTAVKKVLCTASFLQFDGALNACVDYLQIHLMFSNCLGIHELAERYCLWNLKRVADDYMRENFVDVSQQDEFFQLSIEQLVSLIACDDLSISTEETVFLRTMHWVKHHLLRRQKYIPKLLSLVRLPILSPKFLKDEVRPICMKYGCDKLYANVMSWQKAPTAPTELSVKQTRPRWRAGDAELLVVFNSCDDEELLIEIYSHTDDDWKRCGRIKRRIFYATVVLNDSLIFAGGFDNRHRPMNTVLSFDLKNKKCKELCSMQTPRRYFGMAVLDDMIYAVGGRNRNGNNLTVNTVERYDPVANTWQFVASMTYARESLGVAVLNGLLYAVGGYEDVTNHSSTESYNPVTDQWTQCADMNCQRSDLGIASANGFLYAVAGKSNIDDLKTVERYDPRTNRWTRLCSLENLKGIMRCVIVRERLIACSWWGYSEEYNFNENTWRDQGFSVDKNWFELVPIPKGSQLKIRELKN